MIRKHWKIIVVVVILVFTLCVSYFYYYYHIPPQQSEEVIDTVITPPKVIVKLYDIPVDSYNIISDVVKRNEILLGILRDYHLPENAIRNLILIDRKIFDLRKIKSGNKYTLFLDKNDSLQTLRHLVYEHTPIEFVRFSFTDTVLVELGHKEVVQKRKIASGSITSSLWNAMTDNGLNPMLAIELSEIYAWTIDFFGLQPADSFSIVYDEQYVDTISVGLGDIYAAYMRHSGKDFYAIPFVQDSTESYFDTEGNSLRKAFLKAPLRYSRISSRFSHSRLHPVKKIRRPHHGVDYAAPQGTPVQAIGDGVIVEAKKGYNNGGGNMIKIKHNSVYSTAYLHLLRFAPGISQGTYVKQGEIIGYVGSTGLSTGPHLDFRFFKNGKAVDPLKVEVPPVEPVRQENMALFDSVKTLTINLLNTPVD